MIMYNIIYIYIIYNLIYIYIYIHIRPAANWQPRSSLAVTYSEAAAPRVLCVQKRVVRLQFMAMGREHEGISLNYQAWKGPHCQTNPHVLSHFCGVFLFQGI